MIKVHLSLIKVIKVMTELYKQTIRDLVSSTLIHK